MATLDVVEAQVAIGFEDDGVFWHHRLLLLDLGAGRWIAATPDHEVQVLDLSTHTVVAFRRAAAFPERVADDLYAFDPIEPGELLTLREEARGLARVLGVAVPAPVIDGARWLFSDTGLARFGTQVPGEIVADQDRFVGRGSVGCADTLPHGDGWSSCQLVTVEDEAEWRRLKVAGPSRDVRILPASVDAAGRREKPTLSEIVSRFQSPVKGVDWPHAGPSALPELLAGIVATGLELAAYHNYWEKKSGIAGASSVCIEHRNKFEILRLLLGYDLLDGNNVAGIEALARRVLQIQRAVRRCPKHPNFEGLEAMTASLLDETGGVVTSKFDKHFAEIQRDQALILKQTRLHGEEVEHETKRGAKGTAKGG